MKKLLAIFLFPLAVLGQGTPSLRFNTVADMVARPIPTVNNSLTAFVTGRSSINDGGGGTFYFVAADSTATNLGTVFPSTGVVGRWIRDYSGALNGRWFGVLPSASSLVNTTGLTNALYLASTNALSLGEVKIPSGTYTLNAFSFPSGSLSLSGTKNSSAYDEQNPDTGTILSPS